MSYRSSSEHRQNHHHHRNKAFSSSHHSFDRDSGDDDWNSENATVRDHDHFRPTGRLGSFRNAKTATLGGFSQSEDQSEFSVPSERVISYSPVNMYPTAKMVISQVLGGGGGGGGGDHPAPSHDMSFLLSKTRLCDDEDEEDLNGRGGGGGVRHRSFFAHDIDQRQVHGEQSPSAEGRVISFNTSRIASLDDQSKPPTIDRSYDSEPRKTLFIGRLSPTTTEADLRKFFDRFGEIRSLHLIRDILTGDSRRYAFLEYSRSKEADRAYAEGNNATLDGRRILVDREHGREEKTSIKTLRRPNGYYRGSFGGGGGGGPMRSSFSKEYSLSGFPPGNGQRSRPSLHFNGRGGGGGGRGSSHYHPYNNGGGSRSSNGSGGSSYSNRTTITSSTSSLSFSRGNNSHHHRKDNHHHDDDDGFDQSIRSRMHGTNSGGYGLSYRRR